MPTVGRSRKAAIVQLKAIVAGIGQHLKRLRQAERHHTFGEARPDVVEEIADMTPRESGLSG
jgi:hypothetical protein